MTVQDRFIDAMSELDEDLLTAHFQRKCPTKAQKIRKYVLAAAAYAAACLVIALVLPFIIGNGETPAPKPGNDPIITETQPHNTDNTDNTEKEPPLPMAVTTFNGCEFSIILDKLSYTLDDTIVATVTLANKGDEAVGLWQGYLGDFLDEVEFTEDGETRRSYSSDWDKGYAEAIQYGPFEPGKSITHEVKFTPGAPNDTSDPVASVDSLWEITAFVAYYTDVDSDPEDSESIKTATVTIEVPHEKTTDQVTSLEPDDTQVTEPVSTNTDRVDPQPKPEDDPIPPGTYSLPEPDSIVVGIADNAVTLNKGTANFARIKGFADSMVFDPVWNKLWYDVYVKDTQKIKNRGVYAELRYNTGTTVMVNGGEELPAVQRVLIELDSDFPTVLFGDEPYYSGEIYEYRTSDSPDMVKAVSEIVNGKDTPREKLEVDGLEYTVILDKELYTTDDTVIATVILENTGSETITLYKGASGHFLSTVNFYVVGEPMGSMRPSNGHFGETEVPVKQYETFAPGEVLAYVECFNISEADTTKKWNVSAHIEYYDVDKDKTENLDSNNLKLKTLYVEVPHNITTLSEPKPIVPVITENEALSAVAEKHGVTVEYLRERDFGVRGADIECKLVSKDDKSIYRVTFIELLRPPRHGDNFAVGHVEAPLNGNTTDIRLYNGFEYYGYRYIYEVDTNDGEILSVSKTFSGDVEGTPVPADPTVEGSVAYEYYAFFGHSMEFVDDYGILRTSHYTKNKDKLGDDSGHLPILEFKNSSQFTEFSNDIENYLELADKPLAAGMSNFLYQKERFNKEFFNKNNLYLVGLRGTCTAYNHYFNSVTVRNGTLEFEILTEMDYSDSWINEDISVYVLFSVPKDQLKDIKTVDCINTYSFRYD